MVVYAINNIMFFMLNACFLFYFIFLDNRPYHFQAEDDVNQKAWMAVLVNCKEKALAKAFQHANPQMSPSLVELQKTVIR